MKHYIVVACRGRNPERPTDRTAGLPTEQRLERQWGGVHEHPHLSSERQPDFGD